MDDPSDTPPAEDRVLVVALELLRRAVVDLTTSVIANAQRDPDREDRSGLRQPAQQSRAAAPGAGHHPAAPAAARPAAPRPGPPLPPKFHPLRRLDVDLANRENAETAAGWPQLAALLAGVMSGARGGQTAPPRALPGEAPKALGPRIIVTPPPADRQAPAGGQPPPGPEAARPRDRGYAEAGFVRIASVIQSLLAAVRDFKNQKAAPAARKVAGRLKGAASKVGRAAKKVAAGAAGAARKTAGRVRDRAGRAAATVKAAGRRLAASTPARRIRRDFDLLRKAFGKARRSRAGRAVGRAARRGLRGAARAGRAAIRGAGKGAKAAGKKIAGVGLQGAQTVTNQIGAVVAEPFKRLAQVLSPLSVMSEAINSSISGFQLVTAATKLLAAVIAPVLLPGFFLVAVAVTEVADRLAAGLGPALDDLTELFMALLPAVSEMIKVFADGVGWFKRQLGLGEKQQEEPADEAGGGGGGGTFGWLKDGWNNTKEVLGLKGEGNAPPAAEPHQPGSGEQPPSPLKSPSRPAPRSDGLTDETRKARRDVLAEFARSMGPRASTGNIAQRARDVTLAGLNASPFEQKILDLFLKSLDRLNRVANNTDKKPEPRHPGRDED